VGPELGKLANPCDFLPKNGKRPAVDLSTPGVNSFGRQSSNSDERISSETLFATTSCSPDIKARKIDCVVVYKVDRLSRSLLDFSKLISLFDEYQVSFVSVIAHTYREVCAGSQTGPDPEVLAQLEELRQSRQQTHLAARSLLDLKDPDGPLVKSELKRLNDQMKSLDDSIRNLEAATTSASPVDLAEITNALSRLDPIWEVLYPEEQSRILELLIESVTVSENKVDIRFRTNGIEKIVEELTSQN
jgi:hypothetical protein